MPKTLAKNITKVSDRDMEFDDKLNFKELCIMNKRFTWYIIRFCAIGKDFEVIRSLIVLIYWFVITFVFSLLVSPKPPKPKPYEHRMSIYPPPLTMISFSFIEIIIFVIDVISKDSR